MRKSGMTFLEIMIAVVVLAIAMLPIFKMIHKGTEDTDVNASQAFALEKASGILNTILDTIPYEVLRAGNPGFFCSKDLAALAEYSDPPPAGRGITELYAKNMRDMLFGDPDTDFSSAPTDHFCCVGRMVDLRGITYRVYLAIEDLGEPKLPAIPSTPEENTGDAPPTYGGKAFFFLAHLKNPQRLSQPSWGPKYSESAVSIKTPPPARSEMELTNGGDDNNGANAICVPKSGDGDNIYKQSDFITAVWKRYTPRMICDRGNFGVDDVSEAFSPMKKLIVEVKWNLHKPNFSTPNAADGNVQRIHLITLKGDIGR